MDRGIIRNIHCNDVLPYNGLNQCQGHTDRPSQNQSCLNPNIQMFNSSEWLCQISTQITKNWICLNAIRASNQIILVPGNRILDLIYSINSHSNHPTNSKAINPYFNLSKALMFRPNQSRMLNRNSRYQLTLICSAQIIKLANPCQSNLYLNNL